MAYSVGNEPFQIYLSSDGCLDSFPENSPSNFTIALKKRKEFRNKNQKYAVGLARFGYDSAMYNLGENTGAYVTIFVNNKYYNIVPKNEHVSNTETAAKALNTAISNEERVSESTMLSDHVLFESKENEVLVKLRDIDDFGLSPMLRKLLGFHKDKKFKSEFFDFRKICRDFLFEITEASDNFVASLKLIGRAYSKLSFKQAKIIERNTFMKEHGLNIEKFYQHQREDLSNVLQDIIKFQKKEFEEFVSTSYFKGEQTFADYTFEDENEKEISIPASIWTMIDFIVCSVVRSSFFVQGERTISPDVEFNPNLFHCLYVYTNLIKPVDFNDDEFRLLDIVLLKRTGGIQSGVVEHQSTHFKLLEVDTISEISIVITTSLGTPAPFIHGPVFVVLEFRRI